MDNPCSSLGVAARAPRFEVCLVPPDSLGNRSILFFAAIALSIIATIGLGLLLSGFWIIVLYFVGDGLFLVAAILLFRRLRRRSERIAIGQGSVQISRFRNERLVDQRRLAVFGLTLEREDDPDFGCQRVSLVLRGRRHDVAVDLAPIERDAFARRLAAALAEAGGSPDVRRIERPALPAARSDFARQAARP